MEHQGAALCIGGPLDGQRRTILHGDTFQVFASNKTVAQRWAAQAELEPHLYRRERFQIAGRVHTAWVHAATSNDDALAALCTAVGEPGA